MKLKSKKEISKLDETYNLHIKDDHNYIANDAVVSNCHMAKAEVLTKLLTENLRNAPIRWGLTGTVPKEDFEFQGILAAIGPVVGNIAAHELQEKGVLAHLQVNIVQLLDMKEFRNYQEELKYLVTNEDRIQQLASLFNNIRQTGNTLIQ